MSEAESRTLRKELSNLPAAIKAASVGPDAEREVLRLIVRERMLPHIIHAAEMAERAAQVKRVH